jgi:hypothetical protein
MAGVNTVMKMAKINRVLIVGLLLQFNIGFAASLPSHYPASFFYTGTIDDIHLNEQLIIIGDQGFRVSSSLVVNRLKSSKADTIGSLRKGMNVGVVSATNGKSLFEIWELPDNYDHNPIDQ